LSNQQPHSSPRSQIYMPLITTSRSTARVPPLRHVNGTSPN
jgi:hypothetical protein